jgi:4-hydroxybenzoyl-CoA reductase subunit alpha
MRMEYSVIGKRIPQVDAVEKATGEARYLPDIKLPGMLYGKILRSPHPHALILQIDTAKAERLKGVRAVLTAKDTPMIPFCIIPQLANKPPLAIEKVRFIGDEVAAVAAVDEDIAEEALDLIAVEYEELPALFGPLEAMKPGSPKIHDEENNIAAHIVREFGNIEAGFKEVQEVLEDQFVLPGVTHCCLETRGCLAFFSHSGKVTVWSTTQSSHTLRPRLAQVLGIPVGNVRVILAKMGGGFGSRLDMDSIDPIAVFLSKKTGKPVRIINTRDEEFLTSRIRYPMSIHLKTGVRKDGTISALEAKVITDNGAYNNQGTSVTGGIGTKITYLWAIPNTKLDAYVVYTNKPFGGAFRGYGNPQITFALESQMDIIAERLGLDPMEIRLRNVNKSNTVVASRSNISSCGLSECIQEAARAIGWGKAKKKNRGIGIACLMHTGGGTKVFFGGNTNYSDSYVKLTNDGTAEVLIGSCDLGQGSDTVMAQITAEVLGLRMEDVHVISADTGTTPQCLGAWASRQTYVAGNAVLRAAQEIKEHLLRVASDLMEANREDIEIKDRRVYVKGAPDRGMLLGDLAAFCYENGIPLASRGFWDDPVSPKPDPVTGFGGSPTFAFGAQAVEVEVDPRTGRVKIIDFVAAHDLGRTINPMASEGQIEGGILQGIGYGLTEEMVWDEGVLLNPNFQDYKVPYVWDVPEIKTILVESNDPDGPFGAKGIGEAPLIPTAAAVANAVYHAIGIRVKDLPINPQKILKHLREQA